MNIVFNSPFDIQILENLFCSNYFFKSRSTQTFHIFPKSSYILTYVSIVVVGKYMKYSKVLLIIHKSFQALSPSLSTLLLGLKLIQPNWNDNGQNKDLVQAIYMNGQVDFSTDEGKRGYECSKYGGPRFSDWSDVDKILTEESVYKRIFFV